MESGAVALWAFVAPLGALVFTGRARPSAGSAVRRARRRLRRDRRAPPGNLTRPRHLARPDVLRAQRARPGRDDVALLEYFVRSRDRVPTAGGGAGALRAAPPQHLPAPHRGAPEGLPGHHRRAQRGGTSVLGGHHRLHAGSGEALPEDVVALLDEIFGLRRPRHRARAREDQDDRRRLHGRRGDSDAATRSRRGGGPRRARHARDARLLPAAAGLSLRVGIDLGPPSRA